MHWVRKTKKDLSNNENTSGLHILHMMHFFCPCVMCIIRQVHIGASCPIRRRTRRIHLFVAESPTLHFPDVTKLSEQQNECRQLFSSMSPDKKKEKDSFEILGPQQISRYLDFIKKKILIIDKTIDNSELTKSLCLL